MLRRTALVLAAGLASVVVVQASQAQSTQIQLADNRIPLNDPLINGEAGLLMYPRDVVGVVNPGRPDPVPVQWPAAVGAVAAAVAAAVEVAHRANESWYPDALIDYDNAAVQAGSAGLFDSPVVLR
ncbi:MAG: hypothetical protein OXU20_09315 [Myxococcales bacterium]|nr:hypothetical protein [Myxococcales bacterium]